MPDTSTRKLDRKPASPGRMDICSFAVRIQRENDVLMAELRTMFPVASWRLERNGLVVLQSRISR